MSPEAQQIAIAEALGWRGPRHPDIDLNAMREAEITLMDHHEAWENYCIFLRRNFVRPDSAIGATASQRAEAFLRTINRWTGKS